MSSKENKLIREREFRKIIKEQEEISNRIIKLGYIKLKEPIKHGWFKEIIITQNVERYKNKDAMLEIYGKVQKKFWGRTKEKAHKKWIHETSQYLITKDFPTISRKTFNKLSDKAKALCTGFQYRTKDRNLRIRYYINIPKGAYRIKFTRAYITHRKRIDPELESRYKYLENKLLTKEYYCLSQKHYSWTYDKWSKNEVMKNQSQKIKNSIKQLYRYDIDEIIKDKIIWEKN